MRYTGIAEAGEALVGILRRYMVPEMFKSPEQIGLCHPAGRGDCRVGVWLYDIRECEELRSHSMISIDSVRERYAPSYVNLFYMITPYAGGDIRYQAKEEQGILGRVIQILNDHVVPEELVEGEGKAGCSLALLNLPMEEKLRIFNVPNMEYRTSLFYEMGPIEIESERTKHVSRVVDLRFGVEERKRGRR